MLNRLLETKFHMPPWRSGGVTRLRLVQKLNAGLNERRKLTMISAPAGYGKTTLVVDWISEKDKNHTPVKLAWLSLDEADNDPAHFLSYWLSAVRRVEDRVGQSAQSLLGMPQIPPLTAILDELINDLAALDIRIVLVLDDYHVIHHAGIQEAVEYFIDHQPEQMHLVITTRVDPPLPLSRLRARGQMTEIRAGDLRFTLEEARQFFNHAMRLNLAFETVSALEARTEGWAVGLQLAALALQNLTDQQDFLSGFNGSHRYVIDYLLDEVLKRQPPEISEFLSKTAVIDRFNADLCQALTENPESAAILARLERSNLFLIPLDDQRGWYRYHHLFADVLRAGLDAAAEREIRIKSAAWFENQGLFAEAISHWLSVPDVDRAACLIGDLAPELLKNGELQTLLGWLNALPEAVVAQNSDLVSYKALCLLMTGQTSLAREYASQAFQKFSSPTCTTGLGRLLAIQAWFATTAGDRHNGDLARASLEQLDAGDSFFRALALIALGSFQAWGGNLPASSEVFRDTWLLGRQMNHPFIAMGALANLVFNLLEMGQLREAEALCRTALDEYVDSRGRHLPILGIIYAPLAAICYEKGDFGEAHDLAERSIALCRRLFSSTVMGGDSEITLARIAFEQDSPQAAFNLLQSTAETARQRGIAIVAYKMLILQTELYLLQNRLPEAMLKLQELDALEQTVMSKSAQMMVHLRARFLVASGKSGEALKNLDQLEQSDREEGCARRLMGVLITQAMAYQSQGDLHRARRVFESALRMAAPEGYRTLFFPYPGRPIRPLLESARAIAPDFVDGILKTHPIAGVGQSAMDALPEPLSEQEMRVLKLVVPGKSNQEIADELVIGAGTAKWHVHNILQKLGVNNRPKAIARARELGINN